MAKPDGVSRSRAEKEASLRPADQGDEEEVIGFVRVDRMESGSYRVTTQGLSREHVYFAVMSLYWKERLSMLEMWAPREIEQPEPDRDDAADRA